MWYEHRLSALLQLHLQASARRKGKHFSLGSGAPYIKGLRVALVPLAIEQLSYCHNPSEGIPMDMDAFYRYQTATKVQTVCIISCLLPGAERRGFDRDGHRGEDECKYFYMGQISLGFGVPNWYFGRTKRFNKSSYLVSTEPYCVFR